MDLDNLVVEEQILHTSTMPSAALQQDSGMTDPPIELDGRTWLTRY